MRLFTGLVFSLVILTGIGSSCAADWKPQVIQQLNGKAPSINLKGQIQSLTEKNDEVAAAPSIVYMPEKKEVLMMLAYQAPHMGAFMSSKDGGATWSAPWFMGTGADGRANVSWESNMSYMGNGRVVTTFGTISEDYGRTWPIRRPVASCWPGKAFYGWDPMLVDRDRKTGKVTQLTLADYRQTDPKDEYSSHASVLTSMDEGKTWSKPLEVPEWKGVNEVAFVRANNGDMIAACRTDNPQRFKHGIDHYCGLSVSISKDNGATWSPLNRLYEWGRHHPSMVVTKNGDIVLTYVVRKGYVDTSDGFPQFGVEAVVSRDNGKTWDLDHRYILTQWKGNRPITDTWAWVASSQATSTVVLPDGSLLTAFGTGYSTVPDSNPRDVGVVKWKLNYRGLNKDRTIRDAAWDSDTRNVFDPNPVSK